MIFIITRYLPRNKDTAARVGIKRISSYNRASVILINVLIKQNDIRPLELF